MNKVSDLRNSAPKELQTQLVALRRKQLEHRILHRTGQFADIAKFRETRRDIARIKTVLNEQEHSS